MSVFAGIESASVGGGSSRNFEPGNFLVRLEGLKVVESKRNQGTKYAIVECAVMTFSPGVKQHIDDAIAPTPVPAETFAAGDVVAWKVNLSMGSIAMDNLKSFGLAVMRAVALENGQAPKDIGEDQISPAVMDTLFAPNGSPAIGLEMKVEAFNIFTRAGNPFTKLRWTAKSK